LLLSSEKVTAGHVARDAYVDVYVRQSTGFVYASS
jgi:hypothetical protein